MQGQNIGASTTGTLQQQQGPHTRLHDGILDPRVYMNATIRYGMHASVDEPLNLATTLGDNNWKKGYKC
jgi:hypothetical protein